MFIINLCNIFTTHPSPLIPDCISHSIIFYLFYWLLYAYPNGWRHTFSHHTRHLFPLKTKNLNPVSQITKSPERQRLYTTVKTMARKWVFRCLNCCCKQINVTFKIIIQVKTAEINLILNWLAEAKKRFNISGFVDDNETKTWIETKTTL